MRFARRNLALDRFAYWLQTAPRPKRRRPYSPNSIRTYVHNASLYLRWCEANQLLPEQANGDDVLNYLAELTGSRFAPKTISLRHIAVELYYDYLQTRPNPARQVPLTEGKARNPAEPYSSNEVARLYAACRDYQERAVFLLLLAAGPRRSEAYGVTRADVNFDAGTVWLHGKGSKDRLVHIEPIVANALQQAFEFHDQLCPQKSAEYVYRLMVRLGKRAGIPGRHHPHRMRVTFAVQWCEFGGQESELQVLLGHSSPSMTQYYSRVGRERRALKTMSGMQIASRLLNEAMAGVA